MKIFDVVDVFDEYNMNVVSSQDFSYFCVEGVAFNTKVKIKYLLKKDVNRAKCIIFTDKEVFNCIEGFDKYVLEDTVYALESLKGLSLLFV